MVIRVLDHVKSASSYEDGEVIFRLVLNEINRDKEVQVNFNGVTSVPSAFINSAFIRLLEHVSFETIRVKLTFTESTKQINDLIKSRFEFVVKNSISK
jgi:STAS-like domain of unknown function (DUF4325)